MEIFKAVKDVVSTTKAALADGKLSWVEIRAIIAEVLDLVQVLLGKGDEPEKPNA